MKTYDECIAGGFTPTRKYGWFDYKRDYVRHIRKLAKRMGFVRVSSRTSEAIGVIFYKYVISKTRHLEKCYYFAFYDCAGNILPEMRLFAKMTDKKYNIDLILTTGNYESGPCSAFEYIGVPEELIEMMFSKCNHPQQFRMYLENWKNLNILDGLT